MRMISNGLWRTVAIAVIVCGSLGVVIYLLPEPASTAARTANPNPVAREKPVSVSPAEMAAQAAPNRLGDTPLIIPGVRHPALLSGDEAAVANADEVIGIEINGEARAYLVKALSLVDCHVINDCLSNRAVTVTYCDQSDSVRVVTAPDRTEPLDIALGGWLNQKMLLKLGERRYPQDAADLPFDDVGFERTTWAEWKSSHPSSKVYIGQITSLPRGPQTPGQNSSSP